MIIEKYPFETYHEINLDWILKRIQELEKKEDGCQCDTESIKAEIRLLKDQIKSLQNVDEYMQREIDELKLPVMQKKNYVVLFNGIDFNLKAKKFERSAL